MSFSFSDEYGDKPRIKTFKSAIEGRREFVFPAGILSSTMLNGEFWTVRSEKPENFRFRVIQPVRFVAIDKSRNHLLCEPIERGLTIQIIESFLQN